MGKRTRPTHEPTSHVRHPACPTPSRAAHRQRKTDHQVMADRSDRRGDTDAVTTESGVSGAQLVHFAPNVSRSKGLRPGSIRGSSHVSRCPASVDGSNHAATAYLWTCQATRIGCRHLDGTGRDVGSGPDAGCGPARPTPAEYSSRSLRPDGTASGHQRWTPLQPKIIGYSARLPRAPN